MTFKFKDAEVSLGHDHSSDIVMVCTRTIDENGDRCLSASQKPTIVTLDQIQARKLAIAILERLDVRDTR